MRKTAVIVASMVLALSIAPMVGCGSTGSSESSAATAASNQSQFTFDKLDTVLNVGNLTIKYPSSWRVSTADGLDQANIYPPCGGVVFIDATQKASMPLSASDPSIDATLSEYFSGVMGGLPECNFEPYTTQVNGDTMHAVSNFSGTISGDEQRGYALFGIENGQHFQIMAVVPMDQYSAYGPYIEGMAAFASMGPQPGQQTQGEQPVQVADQEPSAEPSLTTGQSNALAKAWDYLSFSPFSYSGLVSQLEYEGFTTDEAIFAVDNCGADWYAQAAAKAVDYLNYSGFSYSGLISQLEYEGFSTEEATYGADSCGTDWNQQAARVARDYIDYSSFSRDGLIDQLQYEGFSYEQAEYGASAVGY